MSNGANLKKLRGELGMSQQALSNLLGVSLQTVWRWENDQFDPGTEILRLIRMLHAGKIPDWCATAKGFELDVATLEKHVKTCDTCLMVMSYLNLKSQLRTRKN
jgi:transcriptional regulator with XRE-family HTH domain